jgi:hypothetical protein
VFCACPALEVLLACVMCMSSTGAYCGLCSVHVLHWRFLWPMLCACPVLVVLVVCVLCMSSAGGSCGLCSVHVQRWWFLCSVYSGVFTYQVTVFVSPHSTVRFIVTLLLFVLVFADRTIRVQQSLTVNKMHTRKSQFSGSRNSSVHGK